MSDWTLSPDLQAVAAVLERALPGKAARQERLPGRVDLSRGPRRLGGGPDLLPRFLRPRPSTGWTASSATTCPSASDAPFEVVAHLTSLHGHRLRVKTALAEGRALATITGLWPSAGFDERETWEMFGIVVRGHPDLRRLLTTEDFEGFPLRKDFPLQGTVGGRIRTDLGKI